MIAKAIRNIIQSAFLSLKTPIDMLIIDKITNMSII